MDDYLCKPFTLDTLQDFLERFVGDRAPAAADGSRPQRTPRKRSAPPTPVPTRPAAPAVDYGALQSIVALGEGSSGDLLSRVVRSYLEAAPPILDHLRQALEGDDGEALAAAAHRLKGSSAQLGVTGVAELCAKLERLGGENGDGRGHEAAATLLGELEEEFGRARAALEEECLRIAS